MYNLLFMLSGMFFILDTVAYISRSAMLSFLLYLPYL